MANTEAVTAKTTEQRPVPLNVWPCAQTSAQWQRQGRYLKESFEHPGKMLPALARRIIETYSSPGDLVVDPMCGIGTTLIEGAAVGRRCIGIDSEPRWADIAAANIDHVLDERQADQAEVWVGDAQELPSLLGDLSGTVDLIATSPPYACEVGRIDKDAWARGEVLCDPASVNYSHDRTNLGYLRNEEYREAMLAVYKACFTALRPGGFLVTVTKNMHQAGRLVHLAGITSSLVRSAGFGYVQHNVALIGGLHDGRLTARPSFWQQTHARRACASGTRRHLVAHEDVLAFIRPEASA